MEARHVVASDSSNRNVIERGMVERDMVENGIVERGIVERDMVERGFIERGMIESGIVGRRVAERAAKRVEGRLAGIDGYVTPEVVQNVATGPEAPAESDLPDNIAGEIAEDSWVDAFVTLLAIVLFGLGWALVELEGADRAVSEYAPRAAETRWAAVDPATGVGPGGVVEVGWRAQEARSSRR